jgi:hypothetical protein
MTALLILILAGGLLVGAGVTAMRRAAQRRTEEVRAFADRLGWGFRDDVTFNTIPDLDRFELFRPGHSKRLCNLITSPPGSEPRAVVFDYVYSVSTGKSQQTHRQTVCYVTSDRLAVPTFSLRPENFFHRVAGMFGFQDIDLERRPEFSRLFLLRGEDEEAVRAAFTDTVTDFFEARPEVCAAGIGREVLFWRAGRAADVGELDPLIRDAFELARRLEPLPRA